LLTTNYNSMKQLSSLLLFLFSFFAVASQPVDSLKFFTDNSTVEMSLSTDIKGLQSQKGDDIFQAGNITMRFADSTTITENVQVGARGKFRRGYCRIPPIMVNFRNEAGSRFNSLGKLKLVIGCGGSQADEELLLKEYLVYKLYNLLEDKSFRVRLMKVNYTDTRNRIKPFTQYAFLIEDDGDMARRNNCKKKEHGQVLTESTNRETMTMVALFEYMIGNTDWSVPNNHNIKLVFDRNKENTVPYPVPYDFDYCGLVNASYAVPNEIIGTEKVTERVYRGFPRSIEEIQIKLEIFRAKKAAIFSTISNFSLLGEKVKKGMIGYLEEFFEMIEKPYEVKSTFVDKARIN
jgi:hypothetical protein